MTSSRPGCDRLSHRTPATSRNEVAYSGRRSASDDLDVAGDEELGPEAHDERPDEQRQVPQPHVQQRVQPATREQPDDEADDGADQEHGDREPWDSLIDASLAGRPGAGPNRQDYLSGGGW